MTKYMVTKEFISGNLEGLKHITITSAKFNVGDTVTNAIGSAYVVTKVVEVPSND